MYGGMNTDFLFCYSGDFHSWFPYRVYLMCVSPYIYCPYVSHDLTCFKLHHCLQLKRVDNR